MQEACHFAASGFLDDLMTDFAASALIGGAGGALIWLAFWPFTYGWRRRP